MRVLGYFTNFVLLAAFLGIGAGTLLARRRAASRLPAWLPPAALLALLAATAAAGALHVLPSPEEFLFLQYAGRGRWVSLHVFLAASYAALAAAFVPLGFAVGRTLDPRNEDEPLRLYAWNLVGSLLGIGAFALAAGAPPWVWMGGAGALAAAVTAGASRASRAAGLALAAATAVLAGVSSQGAIWSPYHKITVGPVHYHPERGVVREWRLAGLPEEIRAALVELPQDEGFVIRVNDDSYQTPLGLGDEALVRRPALARLRRQYDVVHQRRPAGEVLVLGAGTGFMLLEARGPGVLALLLGSTWVVSAAVFAGVVAMGLGATLAAARIGARRWPWLVLFAALAANWAVPVAGLSAWAAVVLVSAPVFASGLLFAGVIERGGAADRALASNLLGALLGGLLEYLSMLVGFRYLVIVAGLFYFLALALSLRPAAREFSRNSVV